MCVCGVCVREALRRQAHRRPGRTEYARYSEPVHQCSRRGLSHRLHHNALWCNIWDSIMGHKWWSLHRFLNSLKLPLAGAFLTVPSSQLPHVTTQKRFILKGEAGSQCMPVKDPTTGKRTSSTAHYTRNRDTSAAAMHTPLILHSTRFSSIYTRNRDASAAAMHIPLILHQPGSLCSDF